MNGNIHRFDRPVPHITLMGATNRALTFWQSQNEVLPCESNCWEHRQHHCACAASETPGRRSLSAGLRRAVRCSLSGVTSGRAAFDGLPGGFRSFGHAANKGRSRERLKRFTVTLIAAHIPPVSRSLVRPSFASGLLTTVGAVFLKEQLPESGSATF
jgi:hypothetical protein